MLFDSIVIYNVTFKKISDFTKFFFSNFLILSLFNIQFHIVLLDVFEKILNSFFDFFNIKLIKSDSQIENNLLI